MDVIKLKDKTVQEILAYAYEERKSRNFRYSHRAFSKLLGIDPSSLSKVMNGRRHLPISKAREVAEILFEKEKDIVWFYKKVLHDEKDGRKTANKVKINKYQLTEKDHYKLIAEWEYFAILNVTTLDDFDQTIPWIAKRLGLSLERTQDVFNQLLQLGFLLFENGKYVRRHRDFNTTDDVSSKAIQEGHRQILGLAADSLTNVPVDKRGFYSSTVVTSAQKIHEAKKMALRFNNKLMRFLETDTEKSEIYQVSLNLFPLTSKARS